MDLIALPGRNPETEDWMRELTDGLDLGQSRARIFRYRHWDDGGEPDVAHEASRVEFSGDGIVVAKSLGSLVLLAAVSASGTRPSRAILIGLPFVRYSPEAKQRLVELASKIPVLIIQQTEDFNGAFADVEAAIGAASRVTLVEVAGNDHVYRDTAELRSIVQGWLAEG